MTGRDDTDAAEGFVLDGVSLRIGGRLVVDGVSARLRPGRVTGLIGPNGSGKTSLLRVLSRSVAPTGGTVGYGGRALGDWSARGFAREVASLPQELPAGQGLSVRELALLGRYSWQGPFRRPGAADRAAAEAGMRVAGVEPLAERLVDTLSGGERQRAFVAMMVAQAGRFLLLDEPTSALDIAHQAHLLALLHEASRARGLGVVLSFHDVNIAARFCDEVLAMKGGRLVAAGPPERIVEAQTLSGLYDVAMATLPHPETGRPIGFLR